MEKSRLIKSESYFFYFIINFILKKANMVESHKIILSIKIQHGRWGVNIFFPPKWGVTEKV